MTDVYAPWNLLILIPLWIVQLALTLETLIAVPVIATRTPYAQGMDVLTWYILAALTISACLIMIEIVAFAKHRLSTRDYLISQYVKATLAVVVLVTMDILTYLGGWYWKQASAFAFLQFKYQIYAVSANILYGIMLYLRYGGDAGGTELAGGMVWAGHDDMGNDGEHTPLLDGNSGASV